MRKSELNKLQKDWLSKSVFRKEMRQTHLETVSDILNVDIAILQPCSF